jgi:Asp-tRNA(Asn)/Glu-tRNA(Gln) amidotransferase A subunit family amidase
MPVYYVMAAAEASSNLARFDGIRYGYRSEQAKDPVDIYYRIRGEGSGAEVKRRIMLGTSVLGNEILNPITRGRKKYGHESEMTSYVYLKDWCSDSTRDTNNCI